jgi:hypothetical protein
VGNVLFSICPGGGFDMEALAKNLTLMGVEASADEDADALVAKILRIRVGDTDVCVFKASLSGLECSYGYFSFGEPAAFAGAATLDILCRMDRAVLHLEGEGAETLSVSSSGAWSETTRSTGVLELTYAPSDYMTKFDLQDALDSLVFSSESYANVAITLRCIGEDGATYYADGSAKLQVSGLTWAALEGYNMTWGDIQNYTWAQLETLPKPD